MYYILTSKVENDNEDAILEGESLYLKRIDCSFCEGIPLPVEDIKAPILFKIDKFALRGAMTDHLNLNDIPGPIISTDAKLLFEKSGIKNIQHFQLTLLDEFPEGSKDENPQNKKKTIEYKKFFIANVVGLIDCINHKSSTLEYFYPPEIREREIDNDSNNPFLGENLNHIDTILNLVLDESKIDPALKVFRLKDQPSLLIFHEDIVKAIRKEKLSGFVFVPVSEYTDAISDDDADTEEKKDEKEESANAKIMSEQKPLAAEAPQQEEEKEKKKSRFNFFPDHK